MTRLLIPLNQLVNPPRIAADGRSKLGRAVPGTADAADLKVGTTTVDTTIGDTKIVDTMDVVPGFHPALLSLIHVVTPANTSLNAASSSPIA
jgi:hypothetical protein